MKYLLLFSWILATGLIACKAADEKVKQDDAMKDLDASFEALKNTNDGDVIDFRDLQKALPEMMIGLERVDYSGQNTGIAGMNISYAEATYSNDRKKVAVKIVDTGGLGGVMSTLAAWTKLELDKEDKNGYERTTLIDGKRAYERFNRTTGEGEMGMIAADRFLITISGSSITEADLRNAISSIKVKS